MGRLSKEKEAELNMTELIGAIRENTNALYQNINETRQLSELLKPSLKKHDAVKMKELERQKLHEESRKIVNSL